MRKNILNKRLLSVAGLGAALFMSGCTYAAPEDAVNPEANELTNSEADITNEEVESDDMSEAQSNESPNDTAETQSGENIDGTDESQADESIDGTNESQAGESIDGTNESQAGESIDTKDISQSDENVDSTVESQTTENVDSTDESQSNENTNTVTGKSNPGSNKNYNSNDNTTSSDSSNSAIYQAYYDEISKNTSYSWEGFQLIDLDGDNFPELFATGSNSENDFDSLQHYMIIGHNENGIVVNDELADGVASAGGYRGTLYYIPGIGKLHDSAVFAPYIAPADTVYKMQDGKIDTEASGYFEPDMNVEPEGDDWDILDHGVWYWDGKEVSYDDYKSKLRSAINNTTGYELNGVNYISKDEMLKKLSELVK